MHSQLSSTELPGEKAIYRRDASRFIEFCPFA
jgi:hypothetical protein